MSTYPSCKHDFSDPMGVCPLCEQENKIESLERQFAEARAEVRQVEQSAINFHEAWQQALNDLESARSALLEVAKIRLEPGYCYEQAVRMQEIAKTVLRRGEG